jgi:hypothetical protein
VSNDTIIGELERIWKDAAMECPSDYPGMCLGH